MVCTTPMLRLRPADPITAPPARRTASNGFVQRPRSPGVGTTVADRLPKNLPLGPGEWIGKRFRILARLGEGGLGTVYSAEDLTLQQQVALKFRSVSDRISLSPKSLRKTRDRLRRGVQVAQRISHPRICRIHDFHQIEGFEFVSMELVEGPSLRQMIHDSSGPLDAALITGMARDICDGLQAIHEQGWVHQDIKPSNLIFDADGRIKITDFDIVGARWRGLTLQYAAPEQLTAISDSDSPERRVPTAASDLFSLGCVLYEAATLHRAFPSGSLAQADPRAPDLLTPDLPKRLVRTIGACLRRDVDARPQSALEVKGLLESDPDGERPPLEAGTLLGARFLIERRLGEGNSGVVYQAQDQSLGNAVALKFWNPEHLVSEPTPTMIEEVHKARQLPRHDRLCQILGFHQVDSYAFASMELVRGEDLEALIAREGRIDGDRTLEIALDLCSGLEAIHRAGLVHQDIEPGNLLIDADGRVKITDLGFAGRHRWWGRTLPYAAPEQLLALEGLRASKPTPAGDLFSLGCVLYEMLTGQKAFPEGCLVDYSPVNPARLFSDIPPLLDQAVQLCLQRSPKRRPSSAAELVEMLRGNAPLASDELSGHPTDPLGDGPGSLARMSRHLFELLAHDPLVLLLLQEHHDLLRALGLILHQVQEEQVDLHRVHHIILPTSRHIGLDTFFSRLGPQCEIRESIVDAAAWEAAIHDRLSHGEQMLLIISGWGRGLEEGRQELGRFLDSLTRQFNSLRAVLIGGQDLAALKFGSEASFLYNAEHLFWPEFDAEDIRRLAISDFPELTLPKAHAQELLELTGGHYRLLRACLRALDAGREISERILADVLWSLFTPFRDRPEVRAKVIEWLKVESPAPYEPWPSDVTLRKLFWSGALADRADRLVWRSAIFQRVGLRVLS